MGLGKGLVQEKAFPVNNYPISTGDRAPDPVFCGVWLRDRADDVKMTTVSKGWIFQAGRHRVASELLLARE